MGAVIAGEFTALSITQLESVGFRVLYIPYHSIVSAFREVGVNVAFDENTPDDDFSACIAQIESITAPEWNRLKQTLTESNQHSVDAFFVELKATLDRVINFVAVIPLYGVESRFSTVSDAMSFLEDSIAKEDRGELRKVEIMIRYSNGDTIDASFTTIDKTTAFLRQLNV